MVRVVVAYESRVPGRSSIKAVSRAGVARVTRRGGRRGPGSGLRSPVPPSPVESDEPSRAGFETKRKLVTTAARGRDAHVVTPAGFGSPREWRVGCTSLDPVKRFSRALFLVCTVVMPHSTFRSLFACLVCVHSNQTNACQGARRSSRGPSPQRDDGDPRSGWLSDAKRGDGSVGLGP